MNRDQFMWQDGRSSILQRGRRRRSRFSVLAVVMGILSLSLPATARQAQNPPNGQTQPPATSPTQTQPPGVIPLPQGPPSTGLQAPLPPPVQPVPPADRPAPLSPTLSQLLGRAPAQPLTIDDAVAIALATNRSLALANEALLRAQGRTSEQRAGFNPTLSATGTYTRLNQGQSVTFGGQHINIVNQDQPTLGIAATLPIDISGLIRAATQQAQFQEVSTRLDINRTRNQIVLDVKTAFYNVLRAQALVTVATENLADSLARLDDAQKKFTAGVVARFDVIRAQTDVGSAQQQLIQARSNVSLAIANLNSTIGIDVNTPTRVTDAGAVETPPGVAPPTVPPVTPESSAPPQNPPPPTPPANPAPGGQETNPATPPRPTVVFDPLDLGPTYDALVREALQQRPEILESDAGIAAAQRGIVIARRSQLPTLGLSYGLLYSPNAAGFSPQTTSGQFVAQISIPLFEGGVARARVQQARADVATAETDRRQSIDLVTLEVRQAYLNLTQARDRVAVANQALVEAQESFRLARVRYNAGVASAAGISPLLEVSDAQAALTQAENNQVNALYDYNNARAQLDKAVGRYAYLRTGPGYTAPPSARTTGYAGPGVLK